MSTDTDERVYVSPGDEVRVLLPHSEVCMHMQVAGEVRNVRFLHHQAQILNEDGSQFSFPVTPGEAGFYADDEGYYCYPAQQRGNPAMNKPYEYAEFIVTVRLEGDAYPDAEQLKDALERGLMPIYDQEGALALGRRLVRVERVEEE